MITPADIIKDPKDAEAYVALMRELPVHTEKDKDDDVLAEVFAEREAYLEIMEGPDEE
jgi:hypothetical protein